MCTEVQKPSLRKQPSSHRCKFLAYKHRWTLMATFGRLVFKTCLVGGLVHSKAWVHFWSLAWGITLYSFDSLLQGGNFSSCKSAGTIALPHPKLTAYFCSCIPHIIHHPEMALSLPSFPDCPLLNSLWSSVSYFNSISPRVLWPRSMFPWGTRKHSPLLWQKSKGPKHVNFLFIRLMTLDGQVQVR